MRMRAAQKSRRLPGGAASLSTAATSIGTRPALRSPARAWRGVTWRNGTNPAWTADFAALRVTPATDWRQRRLAPEIWLLCERGLGATGRRKHYFVSLPATASLAQLVTFVHAAALVG